MTAAPLVAADGADGRAVGLRTGELFTAHGRMVFAICRSILRDPNEAEDATQAAFLSAHEALTRGSVIRDPGAWLATIARNECRARIRSRRIEPLELYADDIADSVTTDDDAERRATVAHLRSAIAALPDKQREAVVLRDIYGLRYGEICVALGVSRPSVEALLFRARRTLRVRLRPVGGAAIAVPAAVREGLAQGVPWFGQSRVAGVSAAAGAGLLAQLGGSVTAKVAVGAVAVGVAGSAGGAGRDLPSQASVPRVAAPVLQPEVREILVVPTPAPTPRRLVPEAPPVDRVEPVPASQAVSPAPSTSARTVARTEPREAPAGRPAASRTEPSTEASGGRVPTERGSVVPTDSSPTRATTTRVEPAPVTTVRATEPARAVSPDTGGVTETTDTRIEPGGTETVRMETPRAPTR